MEVDAVYGQDPVSKTYLCPLRERLGMRSNSVASPELVEWLCFVSTLSLSYGAAAQIAEKTGVRANDSMIHRYVADAGARIEELRHADVDRALEPTTRPRVIAEAAAKRGQAPFSLVVMLDGWMIRERGEQWGLKPAEQEADRVAWREMRSGIVFRLEDLAHTQSGRGLVLEKTYESWRGDAAEFGRRLYALALREGLHQAEEVFVVADGGLWVWNVIQERFAEATKALDYFHASQHLHAVARALHDDEGEAKAWLEPLLHQLKHGGEAGVLTSLNDLTRLIEQLQEERGRVVTNAIEYFNVHKDHLAYAELSAKGCPIGSGAMESTCSQLQDRFKRTGQFWTLPGQRALMTLELIRRNDQWESYFDRLWSQ